MVYTRGGIDKLAYDEWTRLNLNKLHESRICMIKKDRICLKDASKPSTRTDAPATKLCLNSSIAFYKADVFFSFKNHLTSKVGHLNYFQLHLTCFFIRNDTHARGTLFKLADQKAFDHEYVCLFSENPVSMRSMNCGGNDKCRHYYVNQGNNED